MTWYLWNFIVEITIRIRTGICYNLWWHRCIDCIDDPDYHGSWSEYSDNAYWESNG